MNFPVAQAIHESLVKLKNDGYRPNTIELHPQTHRDFIRELNEPEGSRMWILAGCDVLLNASVPVGQSVAWGSRG